MAVATLGEAHDLGWRLTVYCRRGRQVAAMHAVRHCIASVAIDVPTLIWTRGRDFPISDLGARMKCPRCGSRRVMIAWEPPAEPSRKRA